MWAAMDGRSDLVANIHIATGEHGLVRNGSNSTRSRSQRFWLAATLEGPQKLGCLKTSLSALWKIASWPSHELF